MWYFCEIQDALAFMYQNIHLAILKNSKYTNFMQSKYVHLECMLLILRNTSFVVWAEVSKFAYTSLTPV